MKVYLAAPIDNLVATAYSTMVDRLKKAVEKAGLSLTIYVPGRAWLASKPSLQDVDHLLRTNDEALLSSDAVLTWYTPGVESWGVPQELRIARDAGKRVVLVMEGNLVIESLPLYLRACVDVFTTSFDDAVRELQLLDMEHSSASVPLGQELRWLSTGGSVHNPKLSGDLGFDLESVNALILEPGRIIKADAGVRIELPTGTGAVVIGRSGTVFGGILVFTTLIDEGYRGPMFTLLVNMTDKPITVPAGTRVAQLVLLSNLAKSIRAVEVQELSESERGHNGFGSTGSSI